jgi:hypothetical protein
MVCGVLAGCSSSLEETPSDRAGGTEAEDLVSAAEPALSLPPQCAGWADMGSEPLPQRHLYIEFDREIVDLHSSDAGDCMPAVMRMLAEDPPDEPMTIRIGGPEALPSSDRPQIIRAVEALREPARGCGEEHRLVRLQLTVEPVHGNVVDAEVRDPENTPDEACLLEAARALELGPNPRGQTNHFTLFLGVGPEPPSMALDSKLLPPPAHTARTEALQDFIRDMRGPLSACAGTRELVEIQIAFEGPQGEVVDARVSEPEDHPASDCIVRTLVGRKLGPTGDDRRGGARFVGEIGPR